MLEYQKEYENYMKDIVNRFSKICSLENDYWDYVNYICENDRDTRYTFYGPNERTLINMSLDGSFEIEGVKDKILKRQDEAKKWLIENSLSYGEYVKKYKIVK